MSEPTNKALYNKVKQEADKKYSKPSAYKSGWIVREYKERGGEYKGKKQKDGLTRWFREDWEDIGKRDYPVYRPTKRVSKDTPLTPSEIDPDDLKKQIKLKQKIKGKSNLPPFKKISSNSIMPRSSRPPFPFRISGGSHNLTDDFLAEAIADGTIQNNIAPAPVPADGFTTPTNQPIIPLDPAVQHHAQSPVNDGFSTPTDQMIVDTGDMGVPIHPSHHPHHAPALQNQANLFPTFPQMPPLMPFNPPDGSVFQPISPAPPAAGSGDGVVRPVPHRGGSIMPMEDNFFFPPRDRDRRYAHEDYSMVVPHHKVLGMSV